MKRIFLLSAVFLMAGFVVVYGQVKTGSVEYEEVMKIEIKLEGEMAAMARDFPKERKGHKVLYFNEEASLYKRSEVPNEMANTDFESGGGRRMMRMRMSDPYNVVFTDLEKKEVIEQREFMTRMFLIKKEMPEGDWKITGKQKMILDYPCMEATRMDTAGILTTAWFSPAIPVSSGPSVFSNLPGLVLEVNIDEGRRTFTATSISLEAPEKDLLKKPKEGKKVTQEEFDEIVAEKMEEMGIEPGRGPGRGRGMYMIRVHQ